MADRSASIRQRLLNLSRDKGEVFDRILNRFAIERMLYRISCSAYRDQFVLKGAMLYVLWYDVPHRATRDMDLLGLGSSDAPSLESVFRDLCSVDADDGLEFLADSIRGDEIREGANYQGVRIKMVVMLGSAQISLQIDVGFGDTVTPAPQEVEFPVLLDLPSPHLKAYPVQTVVAEKFESIVALGIGNSRMKDFFDLWAISSTTEFEGAMLARAIRSTFERRGTQISSDRPLALTDTFTMDPEKMAQWKGFIRKNRLEDEQLELSDAVSRLVQFVWPPYTAIGESELFTKSWKPDRGWE